ncbi:MAG TPA: F0F1 ATP synthase subunit delta [Brevefilum sp.]|nr:F0F1 ATP synthase subunit delta [Brevefilum sp.]
MLDIDLFTVVAEIINFLVLAVALYFILFKPIVKRMDENAKRRAELLTTAEEMNQQAEDNLALIVGRLDNLDKEIEVHLENAKSLMQAESEALLDATKTEAESILIDAEKEVVKLQQQGIKDFHDELVNGILNISRQVLTQTTPAEVHDNLVNELIEKIWDMGKQDMHQVRTVRDSLTERTPTVHVASAKALTPDQQRALIRPVSALADRNVNMEIDVDPELISGIRVHLGDLIVTNNLAVELNNLKTDIAKLIDESLQH